VFTRKDGQPINPNDVTTRFRKLTDRAGLPWSFSQPSR